MSCGFQNTHQKDQLLSAGRLVIQLGTRATYSNWSTRARLQPRSWCGSTDRRPPPDPENSRMRLLIHTARVLTRQWRFTLISVLLLAVGIATTTVAAEIVYETELRPSPFPDARQLVWVMATEDDRCATCLDGFTGSEFLEWRDRLGSLQGFAAFRQLGLSVADDRVADDRTAPVAIVTGDFFNVLGSRALAGRLLGADADAGAEAVVSQELAQRRFGSPTAAVGRTIHLEGFPFSIIGVLESGIRFPRNTDVWISQRAATFVDPGRRAVYEGIGRLGEGVTLEHARDEVRPRPDGKSRSRYPLLQPLDAKLRLDVGPLARVFIGAAVVSFLVACVNLAAVATARAIDRKREVTIRVALGATIRLLLRQVIVESALLVLAGGSVGIVVALVARPVVASALRLDSVMLGGRDWGGQMAFASCALLALFAVTVVIGVIALLHSGRSSMRASLQSSALSATASRSQRAFRQFLVALQVTMAVTLGATAIILSASMHKLSHIDVGYDADSVVVTSLDLRGSSYAGRPKAQQLANDIGARLAAGPVAASALWTKTPPGLLPASSPDGIAIEGRTEELPAAHRLYMSYDVSDGFIHTMGLSIVLGRRFVPSDYASGIPVVIVNEASARRWWPNESPLGKRIKFGGRDAATPWATVVGVVANSQPIEDIGTVLARNTTSSGYRLSMIFRPLSQGGEILGTGCAVQPCGRLRVGVRSDRQTLARSWLRSTLADAAPGAKIETPMILRQLQLTLSDITTLRDSMRITSLLAMVISLLAMVGLYSVVAETVRRREREIGIRVALGSTWLGAVRLVALDGMKSGAIGSAVGCAMLVAFEPVLRSVFFGATDVLPRGLLFGVGARDPIVLAGAAVAGVAVASLASLAGGWKAASVEPGIALRSE